MLRAGRSVVVTARRPRRVGVVSLVGAGPGDPGLLTVRAVERLASADVVFYDGLVPAAVVALAGRGARRVSVARRVGPKALTQAQVSARLVAAARRGQRVVRLKAGDPFVFGRGGEETAALAAARVPFEIVPGVSSALAAPALAGIPVTHRDLSSAMVIVTGHDPAVFEPVLAPLAPGAATIVVLMGIGFRRRLAQCLMDAGWRRATPVAIVLEASRPGERLWIGSLATLGVRDGLAGRDDPGVLVIGEVVRARSRSRRPRLTKTEMEEK